MDDDEWTEALADEAETIEARLEAVAGPRSSSAPGRLAAWSVPAFSSAETSRSTSPIDTALGACG